MPISHKTPEELAAIRQLVERTKNKMSRLSLEDQIHIKNAHISELRHALGHLLDDTTCDECKRVGMMAMRHETWWDHLDEEKASPQLLAAAHKARDEWLKSNPQYA